MADQIRAVFKFHLILAAAIYALGFILAWTGFAGFLLLVFGGPVLLLTFVIGGLILVARGVKRARAEDHQGQSRAVTALAAPVMLVLFVLVALHVLAAGAWTGQATRLLIYEARYGAIIEKVRAEERSANHGSIEEDGGIRYVVDEGPPVRVAFEPEGILDNWSGIVFDPTGDVMLAEGLNPDGGVRGPQRVTMLFGGDLVSCRPLWGGYFTCSFT